jgi:glyoxylate/hydroxypyruvate reductase A
VSIIIICPNNNPKPWITALTSIDPSVDIQIWPSDKPKSEVTFALCWQPPRGILNDYPNLQCICSMGAGVDHLFKDRQLPSNVPIVRLVDPAMNQSMFEYISSAALFYLRNTALYQTQQLNKLWLEHPSKSLSKTTIGVMGLGQIGKFCAIKLSELGFTVKGWSKTSKTIEGVKTYTGDDGLVDFTKDISILVCLLPLTNELKGILNLKLFHSLPKGCCLINVARGEHLVESDLLTALSSKHLDSAFLDVFIEEPLPQDHPFWSQSNIQITPHCSSSTEPLSVAEQIINNYRLMKKSKKLINLVDINKGY